LPQIKETSNGEGPRKEIYNMAQAAVGRRKVALPIFPEPDLL
jgi:hypothetical protein